MFRPILFLAIIRLDTTIGGNYTIMIPCALVMIVGASVKIRACIHLNSIRNSVLNLKFVATSETSVHVYRTVQCVTFNEGFLFCIPLGFLTYLHLFLSFTIFLYHGLSYVLLRHKNCDAYASVISSVTSLT